MKPEEPSELAAYDRLVDESPQGILFCHSWWLDAVAPGRYQILTVERGGAIKAALPIVFRDWAAGLQIGMPELTHKLGILFAPSEAKYAERLSDEHELVGQLIEKLPAGCSFDQQFHENFTNWLPFYWEGFSQSTRYTYIIDDLSDVDAIWGNFRTEARRDVEKATQDGLRVRETDDIELLYDVNRKTLERLGISIMFDVEFLARIDAAASKNAGRKAFVAEDPAGRTHACEYLLYDKRCAILLLKARRSRPAQQRCPNPAGVGGDQVYEYGCEGLRFRRKHGTQYRGSSQGPWCQASAILPYMEAIQAGPACRTALAIPALHGLGAAGSGQPYH